MRDKEVEFGALTLLAAGAGILVKTHNLLAVEVSTVCFIMAALGWHFSSDKYNPVEEPVNVLDQ